MYRLVIQGKYVLLIMVPPSNWRYSTQSQTMHGDTARLSAISPGFSNFPVEFCLNLWVMCIAFGLDFFSVVQTLDNSNHTIKQSSGLYVQCVVLLGVSYMWRFRNMAIRGSLTGYVTLDWNNKYFEALLYYRGTSEFAQKTCISDLLRPKICI